MVNRRSNWLDFITDYGDALGGIFVGYGIAKQDVWYGAIGITLILLSIYLKHYHGNKGT